MTDPKRPHGPLETWGAELRFRREAAGLTQLELAETMNYSDSYVSAIEQGKKIPTPAFARAGDKALKTGGALVRLLPILDGARFPEWFRPWPPIEAKAEILRTFQLGAVYSLLQTEQYARAQLGGDEDAVAARLERQHILYRTNPEPPMVRIVLDELVLHRKVGSPKIMRDQLLHIVASASPRRSIQVVPNGVHPGILGSFVLATTADGREVAYVETAARGQIMSGREDLAAVRDIWEEIRTCALPQQQSLELISRLADELWS